MVLQAAVGFFRRRLSAAGTPERRRTSRASTLYLPNAQRRTLGLAPWRDGRGAPYARGQGTRVGPRSAGR
jgi:hypothetical protein